MSTEWPHDPETGELLDDPPAMPNVAEFSVSELSFALKRTLEDTFGYVRVRGELGRISRPGSGHVYLDLKDEKAVLSGVIWKGVVGRMKIQPEQGMEVVVTGKITTFPGQSRYQIIIDTMEPAGAGALMALLEERRKKLAAEGLFDDDRKKDLPYLPRVIGVVTSPTGAVIRDILHRLNDRFPRHVLVWPVRVQGEKCAEEVARGIGGMNDLQPDGDLPRPDLIIVARGGGSLEDLWGFNEEIVVRAAAASIIPLVSAVGHETDWTLIDHAADWRAPTPTAAAERAVPVRDDLLAQVADRAARQSRALRRSMDERQTRITAAARALPRPDDVLALARQRFDGASGRLVQALRSNLSQHRGVFERLSGRLSDRPLRNRLTLHREALQRHQTQADRAIRRNIDARKQNLVSTAKLLVSLSYENVVKRGFAVVWDSAGAPLSTAKAAKTAGELSLEFQDGRVNATVDGAAKPEKAAKTAKRKPPHESSQGDLF